MYLALKKMDGFKPTINPIDEWNSIHIYKNSINVFEFVDAIYDSSPLGTYLVQQERILVFFRNKRVAGFKRKMD